MPVLTKSTGGLALNATSLIISGFGFDTASNDTVTFSGGGMEPSAARRPTVLTVTFASPSGLKAGILTANVADGFKTATVEVAIVSPLGSRL